MRIRLPGIVVLLIIAALVYFVFLKPKGGFGFGKSY